MRFEHELILVIVNRGFADDVMDAARAAGAFGGTVVNARGTGTEENEQFFGTIIQPEKELVMILTAADKKAAIMTAIAKNAGLDGEGKGMCMSLPVDGVTGIVALKRVGEAQESKGE